MSRLARFAWAVLAYNIAVIVWGAYVRATGSGAGCGAHWPLCNGEILPRAARVATLDRVLASADERRWRSSRSCSLVIWTWRACRPGHPARLGAALSLFFMLTEAAVGAGLVLFQLVADNASFARAMFLSVHLINTFTLLACLTLDRLVAVRGRPDSPRRPARPRGGQLGLLCAGVLIASTSGAVAALGDTLFPVSSLTEASVGRSVDDLARADSAAHPASRSSPRGGNRAGRERARLAGCGQGGDRWPVRPRRVRPCRDAGDARDAERLSARAGRGCSCCTCSWRTSSGLR